MGNGMREVIGLCAYGVAVSFKCLMALFTSMSISQNFILFDFAK